MMDLHSRMQRMAGPVEETPEAVIQDDLARGRRAVRRRRILQGGAASVFAVAAVAAALAVPGEAVHGPATPVAAPSAGATTAGVKLVSYTGKQPHLFTIDTVPQGFFVQGQNGYELVLAPESAKKPDPGKPYLADPRFYTDKIAVFLQNKDYTVDPDGDEQFTIGDKPAALRITRADGTTGRVESTQIYVVESPRVYLTVQFDVSTGLTKDQMIEVASGIHISAEAVAKAEAGYASQKEHPKTGGN